MNRKLDPIDLKILELLQEDGRLPFAVIGRRVGMSIPTVSTRVRRMEEMGVITGYTARVDPSRMGLSITAYILMAVKRERYPQVLALAGERPQVLECHHVSGSDSFLLKATLPSLPALERLIEELGRHGDTRTLMVLSSPVVKRVIRGE